MKEQQMSELSLVDLTDENGLLILLQPAPDLSMLLLRQLHGDWVCDTRNTFKLLVPLYSGRVVFLFQPLQTHEEGWGFDTKLFIFNIRNVSNQHSEEEIDNFVLY